MARANPLTVLGKILPFLRYLFLLKDLTVVFVIVGILAVIIVPLPSGVLDFFLTMSISVAVLVILISIFIAKPTDFTTYPTLILLVTLFRISLNIATTRMILSEGHNGPEAVSDIISSFGNFVVGGNYVIGIIVFTILVLVNFMVVTNGSTRVAEVSARFTLDAMPGKQMAIDADLNAGLIDEAEARKRRQEIIGEANFYGAMDGSSKFIKGDAIASIIITIVNIVGGILIGVFQHDLTMADSAATYTILTIGDGLVGQIPALLVSTATGIIITRASKDDSNFASGVIDQLGQDYRVLLIVGGVLVLFAAVPGLPALSLGFVGLAFLVMALLISDVKTGDISKWLQAKLPFLADLSPPAAPTAPKSARDTIKSRAQATDQAPPKPKEKTAEEIKAEDEKAIDDILKVELLELDVGYQLIKLADKNQGGDLLDRIRTMRRKIASEYGFLMPQVRIRDNLQLEPNSYEIMLKGVSIGSGDVYPGHFLAMNSGLVMEEIDGIATKEPAFGLDAVWVQADRKEDAIIKGYTVVDPATVITTHLSELVKKYSEEMLTRQDVMRLVESLKKDYPAVVDDALRAAGGIGLVQSVLKSLLHDKIPIKDMLTIMETIADVAQIYNSVEFTVEHVRMKLARTISSLYKTEHGTVRLIAFDTRTEEMILGKLREQNGSRHLTLTIKEQEALLETVKEKAIEIMEKGISPVVLIIDPRLRKVISSLFENSTIDIVVLSYSEIDSSTKFEILGSIEVPEIG